SNSLKNAINTPELDKQIHIEYLVITTRVLIVFDYPSTTYTNTLSLHDALPIWRRLRCEDAQRRGGAGRLARSSSRPARALDGDADRKSTRLNSSHSQISYAVFCMKKKKPGAGRRWPLRPIRTQAAARMGARPSS